ncbi:MAG: hypothetical protein GX589_00480, partial [Deltaproteobacteria bacterium]|nr:hypothetical protein [Deltaproteobacteria bacterium]
MQTFNELIRHNQRATIALVVALALFLGLLGGLIAFFCTDTYSGEPDSGAVIYGVLIGFSLAIWGSLISYYCGAMVVMGIADGHRVEREDDLLLHNVTSEMALAAGIPMPSIFIIPDPAP